MLHCLLKRCDLRACQGGEKPIERCDTLYHLLTLEPPIVSSWAVPNAVPNVDSIPFNNILPMVLRGVKRLKCLIYSQACLTLHIPLLMLKPQRFKTSILGLFRHVRISECCQAMSFGVTLSCQAYCQCLIVRQIVSVLFIESYLLTAM